MLNKVARKPSADPAQEKLRTQKAAWNKEVSAFISDLINFKQLMNGAPNKFHKEKSKIIEPIPSDPSTIIGLLTGDFDSIANKGNTLIRLQLDYSKNRRKKQPKQLSLPFGSSPTNTSNLSEQLNAAAINFELEALGSNPVSRFFTRLLNPGIGISEAARIRKYRMSLLSGVVQSYWDLFELQKVIMGSDANSIFTSRQLLNKIYNNWKFIKSGLATYANNMPANVPDQGGKISLPKPVEENIKKEEENLKKEDINLNHLYDLAASEAIKDYRKNILKNLFPDLSITNKFNSLIEQFTLSEDKSILAPEILKEYKSLIEGLNNLYQVQGKSFQEIVQLKGKKKGDPSPQLSLLFDEKKSSQDEITNSLNKVAQNYLSRWFGKTKHQLSPFDKTSAVRLDIYKMAEKARDLIDDIMDHLEKELNIQVLTPMIDEVEEQIILMRQSVHGLEMTMRGVGFDQAFVDLLEKGQLGDYHIPMTEKQKEHLQRTLETKRFRDLGKLYMDK